MTNPLSWGDIWWQEARTYTWLYVDVFRVTQGLEVEGGGSYDLIAGKDTLARCQFYTLGPPRLVAEARCSIQRISPAPAGPQEVLAVTRAIPGSSSSAGRVARKRARFFNGSPVFDFWVPARMVATAGQYRFSVRGRFEGDSDFQSISYECTKTFQPTRDLNVLLVPWDQRPHIRHGRAWGNDLTAAIPAAMREMQRLMPLRAGVAPFYFGMQTDAGLRYLFHPVVNSCRPGQTFAAEDRRQRTEATDLLQRINRQLAAIDPGRRLGRLDLDYGMAATTRSLGGQAQYWSTPPCAAGGFDTEVRGFAATCVMHELAHCLWQVRGTSPNRDGTYTFGNHSRNVELPLAQGLPVVDMLARRDARNVRSVLYGTCTAAPFEYAESYEWNDMRRSLIGMPVYPAPPPGMRDRTGSPRFHLVGGIDLQDNVVVDYSECIEEPPMELTPTDPSSSYNLAFVSGTGTDLAVYPFKVTFEFVDEYVPGSVSQAGIIWTTPLPSGSARESRFATAPVCCGAECLACKGRCSPTFRPTSGARRPLTCNGPPPIPIPPRSPTMCFSSGIREPYRCWWPAA